VSSDSVSVGAPSTAFLVLSCAARGAGSAANQQWRGSRAVASLAKQEAPEPLRLFRLPALSGPPFAALPFLTSQVGWLLEGYVKGRC